MVIDTSDLKISHEADGLHVYLEGRFTASVANRLLYFMRAYFRKTPHIHIHTDGVTSFETLGLGMFQQGLGPMKNDCSRFLFTGFNASRLADVWPESKRFAFPNSE
ncbi:MAG: hypothetical protein R6U50_07615 [Desulfobacterales bacterium]